MTSSAPDDLRLFVYGLLLTGEREHDLLAEAVLLGEAETVPRYTLADLGVYPALLERGTVAIHGELYRIDRKIRFQLDVKHEVPVLFRRIKVELADGTTAETYAMKDEQVRGKRRLAGGDWKGRFAPRPRTTDLGGPLVNAAKRRFERR
ncbi:MAG TPA: gamma-glutamylcyclotransferase family protein [Polyangiaceae bacterium]|nr:gamma-glutamylcyclotransferase family protein [Polyangiaceae bacterium]